MLLLLLFVSCAKVLLCDATTTTTCEGSTLNIKCPAGNIINIHDADYGRHSYLTCIGLPISFNKNCSAPDSLEIVKRRCNEQDACSIDVSNSVFGDPCSGTHKYLTVDYTCELIHTELQELITCQDHDMILSCSDGMFLEIIYANYGRSCEDQCPSPGLRTDMNCSAANSSEIVENSCNGLNMCFVNVTNNIFGDPCPSVSKYLEVNYTCSLGRQTTNTTTETSIPTNNHIFEIVKCQNSILDIGCPKGLINIIYANFGRTSLAICPNEGTSTPTQNDNCFNDNSTEILRRSCENNKSCSVNVSISVFGDTCPGTAKYLEVIYDCEDLDSHLKEKSGCENTIININCEPGTAIDIVAVVYGRLSNSLCTTGNPGNSNCSAENALGIVDDRCDNKESCAIEASNSVFGDPCPGIEKYLQINYTCYETITRSIETTHPQPTRSPIPITEYACEDTDLTIGCPDGNIINVLYANFGRSSIGICPNPGRPTPNCINNNSTEIVRQKCENKELCTVNASSNVFGNDCPNTYKYLEVIYTCELLDPALRNESACENTSLTITCEAGTKIDIVNAVYGRLSNSVCNTTNFENLNCSAEDALTIVEDSCDNKESCTIEASNGVFGNPCPGIDKYLQINYTCFQTINTTPNTSTSPTTQTPTNSPTIPTPNPTPIPKPTPRPNITVVACQNTMLAIGCPTGYDINILYANFGRLSAAPCNFGNRNQKCVNNNSTEIVRRNCENKENCFISASTSVFGNSCPGTSNYLEVVYSCEDSNSNPQEKSACENTSLTITCETGTTIDIVNAVYGRLSNSVCNSTNSGNLNCSAEDALTIVEDSCDYKDSCTIEASNGVFGNPCPGIDKYLQINYTCFQTINTTPNTSTSPTTQTPTNSPTIPTPNPTPIPKPTPRPNNTVVACQNTMLAMGCPTGYDINILYANFGRLSAAPCNFGNRNQKCVNNNSTEIVRRNCENKENCFISASTSVFGNSCPGTSNYLEVVYSCEDSNSNPQEKSACENTSLTITCETGTTIDIVNAVYGRLSNSVCNSTNSGNLNCSAEDALTIVEDSCDYKDSCTIEASNGVFGNPCPGIDKYLQINYTCFQTINTTPNTSTSPTTQTPTNSPTIPTPNPTPIPKPTPRPNNTVVACQNTMLAMGCPTGYDINILYANFGRLSAAPCNFGNRNQKCVNNNSTEIVRRNCENKENCFISASTSVFGNSCPGTSNYLEVVYSCEDSNSNPQEKSACENTSLTITCETGTTIDIVNAVYGRLSNSVCNSTNSGNLNCSAEDALTLVEDSCDYKESCTIEASNGVFGNPCPGIDKYLQINYTCFQTINTTPNTSTSPTTQTPTNSPTIPTPNPTPIPKPTPRPNITVVACQNTMLAIGCPTGYDINILYANFGRLSAAPCNFGNRNQKCVNNNSTEIVRRNCENKENCFISASTSVFGNSCPGTSNYLEVVYSCEDSNSNPQEKSACENTSLTITCETGTTIDIVNAVYGRLSNSVCNSTNSGNLNCSAEDALTIVEDSCDYKESCTIEASNGVFGNPCPGIDKYLQINYTCFQTINTTPNTSTSPTTQTPTNSPTIPTPNPTPIPKPTPRPNITVVACQNTMLAIGCPTGYDINILYANFGRLSAAPCNFGNRNQKCVNNNSTEIVRRNCENKENCFISASTSVFGNSCPGTSNYLEVVYSCEDSNSILDPQEKSACENTSLTITCETGTTIDIVNAVYGRLSNSVCNSTNSGNLNCSAEDALTIVEDSCDYKDSCTIEASNGVFGNPCPGIDKYLQINYTCFQTINTTPNTSTSPTTQTPTNSPTIPTPNPTPIPKPTPRPNITVVACQNTMLAMGCPTGYDINILYANFGRLSAAPCNFGNGNLTCVNNNSTEIVRRNCENKETCFISASTSVFGNSCPGTSNYLEVVYSCEGGISKSHEISACENSSLTITCDAANTAIDIIGGVYGRVSNSVCVTTNPGSLNCSAEDALRIIEDSCDDKKTCTVEASSQIFGDPCSGIEKYLQINYTCIPGPTLGPGNGLVILNVTACEDTNLTIACPATDYIFVYKANYGRTSISVCNSSSSDQNINCTSPRSTSIVADRCDGLNTCTINASDSEFPDTCASTFKYLEVEYVCLHRITTEIPLLNKTACENTTLSINCSTDATINITSANYGRTNSLICPRVSQDQIDNCTDPNSYKSVSNRCTGQESCSIQATNSEFGSDPCPGTFKYLEVEYDCINKVDTIPFSGTACDGVTLELECSAGLNIEVLAANYGRLSNSICPKQGVDNVNNCSSVNATDIVSQRCNGAENCSIQASNSTFGDPCPGIYKYLIVYYSCIGSYIQCGINEHINCSNHCTNRFCGSAITESCANTCEQGCVCNEGYNRDPLTGICINTKYCPLKGQPCQTHEHFTRCGADCQSTCSNATQTCENCSPGYICNSGFVRDEDTGRCVRPEDCPCSAPVAVT